MEIETKKSADGKYFADGCDILMELTRYLGRTLENHPEQQVTEHSKGRRRLWVGPPSVSQFGFRVILQTLAN